MIYNTTSAPLDGDRDKSGGMFATTLLVSILAIIFVALRMMTRVWIVKKVGWDDYTIILAMVNLFPSGKICREV